MKGERERPHVSDRGLDGKRANKKEPMERLSVPCLRNGHGSTGRHQHPGCHSLLVQKKFAYTRCPQPTADSYMQHILLQEPGVSVFKARRRAPGKKAHRLMTPHLWSTLQVGALDHSHAFWNYSCEMFGGVAWWGSTKSYSRLTRRPRLISKLSIRHCGPRCSDEHMDALRNSYLRGSRFFLCWEPLWHINKHPVPSFPSPLNSYKEGMKRFVANGALTERERWTERSPMTSFW